MKKSLISCLAIMALALVGCGGKDNDSGHAFSNSLSTQTGYLNLQTQALEVGGTSYPPSTQYAQMVNQAIQQAQMQNIKPVQVNGVWKLRARITAQVMGGTNYNNSTYNPYGQYYGNTSTMNNYGANTLSISSIVFY